MSRDVDGSNGRREPVGALAAIGFPHAEREGYVGDAAHRAAFLNEHPDQAIAAIEKEALRRRRKQKTPQPQLQILEPGLWSAVPEQVWQLELRLSEKQGTEFRLLAPDEPAARSAYAAANPNLVQARKELLASLAPAADLFADDEEAAPADDDDEPEDVDSEKTDE